MVNSVEGPPQFQKPDFNLSRLLEFANVLVGEQARVERMGLVREYNQIPSRGQMTLEMELVELAWTEHLVMLDDLVHLPSPSPQGDTLESSKVRPTLGRKPGRNR